jgi:hypothetical protein
VEIVYKVNYRPQTTDPRLVYFRTNSARAPRHFLTSRGSHFTRISRGSHADLTRISRGSHADLTRHFPRIHDATFYTPPPDLSGAFEATHFESRHVAAMKPREIDPSANRGYTDDRHLGQKI